MAVPIIPRLVRGRLYFQTAEVLFPTFAQAATAWSAAEAHRLDVAELIDERPTAQADQQQPPVRRCDDCALDLGRDVLRALGTCPRWGTVRAGVETSCPPFVAKDGGR
jgi:hypothetical protein